MARHPIPTALLARLAMPERAHGRGIRRLLVGHAAILAARASRLLAVRMLAIDALDPQTAEFYEHLGFTPVENDPLRLELLVKDLAELIENRVG
jgi:GNAT superfamily N-acetyltransferase